MKLIICLLLAMSFSLTAFSHCGVCGSGDAKDHKEMGGDDSHHDEDAEYSEENPEESPEDSDEDGEEADSE